MYILWILVSITCKARFGRKLLDLSVYGIVPESADVPILIDHVTLQDLPCGQKLCDLTLRL